MTRLALNVNGYNDADVVNALEANGRAVSFTYEHLDDQGNSLGYLVGVSSAAVHYNADQQIKRTASFTIVEAAGDNIDYGRDRIRPYMGVQMPDGGIAWCPLGVFVLASSGQTFDGSSVTRTPDGYDLTQILTDDKVETTYVVKQGTAYTDALAQLLSPLGPYFIADSATVLAADQTWDPGTSKADIVAALLTGLGYQSLWFDAWGTAQALNYVAPADDSTGYDYATDDESLVTAAISQTLDLFEVPNVFVRVITVSNKPLLSSYFTNASPDSPTSTVRRGRRIVDWAEANDAADQAALDALCRKAATEAAQIYQTVALNTVLMPFHQDRDVFTVEHSGLGISATFCETAWDMDLSVGGVMNHTITAVVAVDPTSDVN